MNSGRQLAVDHQPLTLREGERPKGRTRKPSPSSLGGALRRTGAWAWLGLWKPPRSAASGNAVQGRPARPDWPRSPPRSRRVRSPPGRTRAGLASAAELLQAEPAGWRATRAGWRALLAVLWPAGAAGARSQPIRPRSRPGTRAAPTLRSSHYGVHNTRRATPMASVRTLSLLVPAASGETLRSRLDRLAARRELPLLPILEASACDSGYRTLLRQANSHAAGRRIWAVEGTGSYGSGLADLARALREIIAAGPTGA